MLHKLWTSRSLKVKCVIVILLVVSCFNFIESKPISKLRANQLKKAKQQMKSEMRGLRFVLFFFALTFIPLVCVFCYNVFKDPLTPTLLKNGTQVLKERTMGFLSKKRTKVDEE